MKLIVNPHKIEIIKDELVNEREIDISKCTFEFAEEITQEYVKEAYFTYNGETYKQIINNNECAFPSEVLEKKGMVEIGVVAYLIENEQEIKRYNPSPAYFNTLQGSLKDAENSEPITPSEMEQFEQQLQNGLNSIDDKLDEVDTKMKTVDTKIDEIDTAIEETNNLDLDVNKQDNKTTVTITKKNGSTKSVDVLDGTDGQDGTSLQFMWQGTSLGIKTDDMQDYVFVDLQGVQGQTGPQGEPFTIKKTYSSIAEMNADFDNMELGDYVMIASSVEIEDNAKLYTKGEQQWIFITDFSGSTGIRGETGLTPNIQIGTVTSGATPSVTRTGTNENPILNFVLEKGEKGNTGSTGPQGETGNGIASVTKTSTSGLVDTYTITYTNGNTSTFTVTNGKGISSIAKTGTSGLVDTYTVKFNDNTTMTYTVTNGKDGVDGEVTQEQLDQVIKDLEYWKTTNNALPKVEGEGTDITLDNTADSPLTLGFKANESTQDLEPSPDYPQDIHVIKGDNEVIIENKNLFDKNTITQRTYLQEDGTLLTGTIADYNTSDFILIKPNTSYYKTVTGSPRTKYYDINKQPLNTTTYQDISIGSNAGSFTTPSNAYYLRFTINTSYVNLDEIQIEKGTQATPYTEHKEQNYPLNLGVKNLFDYSDTEQVYPYTLSCANVKPNTTYYIKAYNITGSYTGTHALYTKINNEWVFNSSRVLINGFSFTTPENCTKIGLNGLNDPNLEVCQIEEGNKPHSYNPYGVTPIEMCNINNYADEFFKNVPECEYYDNTLEEEKWYKYGRIGKVVLDGSEDGWTLMETNTNTMRFVNSNIIQNNKSYSYYSNYFMNNYFKEYSGNSAIGNIDSEGLAIRDNYNGVTIRTLISRVTDLAGFKNWLQSNNTIIDYVLATPTKTLLSDTLQEQLDNIYYAMAYQDQTNISQVNEDRPFIISAKTVRDMSNIFEIVQPTEL